MTKKLKLAIVAAVVTVGLAVAGYFTLGPGSGDGYSDDTNYSDTYGGY